MGYDLLGPLWIDAHFVCEVKCCLCHGFNCLSRLVGVGNDPSIRVIRLSWGSVCRIFVAGSDTRDVRLNIPATSPGDTSKPVSIFALARVR